MNKLAVPVILSEAKDPSILFSVNAEMLRYAQHDISGFFHTF
mgnify:FL=1